MAGGNKMTTNRYCYELTYVLPILRLFFPVDFFGYVALICLFELFLGSLKQIARLHCDELHWVDSWFWWSSFWMQLLNIVWMIDFNLCTRFVGDIIKNMIGRVSIYLPCWSFPVFFIHFNVLFIFTRSVAVESFTRRILTACVHHIRWWRWHRSRVCSFQFSFLSVILCPVPRNYELIFSPVCQCSLVTFHCIACFAVIYPIFALCDQRSVMEQESWRF